MLVSSEVWSRGYLGLISAAVLAHMNTACRCCTYPVRYLPWVPTSSGAPRIWTCVTSSASSHAASSTRRHTQPGSRVARGTTNLGGDGLMSWPSAQAPGLSRNPNPEGIGRLSVADAAARRIRCRVAAGPGSIVAPGPLRLAGQRVARPKNRSHEGCEHHGRRGLGAAYREGRIPPDRRRPHREATLLATSAGPPCLGRTGQVHRATRRLMPVSSLPSTSTGTHGASELPVGSRSQPSRVRRTLATGTSVVDAAPMRCSPSLQPAKKRHAHE